MIREIRLKNLKLIGDATIDLHPGLNVITGETGSGKTIFVRTILSALGLSSLNEIVRTGSESYVEIELEEPQSEEGYFVIRREVSGDKRMRSYLNGRLSSVDILREMAEGKIVVHSQNQTISLLKKSYQQRLFDSHDDILSQLLNDYTLKRNELIKVNSELKQVELRQAETARKIAEIKEFLQECERTGLNEVNESELKSRREMLKNLANIVEALSRAIKELKEEDSSAVERIGKAILSLERVAHSLPQGSELIEKLNTVISLLEDVTINLSEVLSSMEADDLNIEDIEYKLYEIQRIKRKFGIELSSDINEVMHEKREALKNLESNSEELTSLKNRFIKLYDELDELAHQISSRRKSILESFNNSVNRILEELNLGSKRFRAVIKEIGRGDYPLLDLPEGYEEVHFEFKTGNEEFQQISKVASGGELSRLMLALETFEKDESFRKTYIFDEIDTGIGGATAVKVGRFLKNLSKKHQVVVITHLAQIAAFADWHISIKKVEGKESMIQIQTLESFDDRVREIARMLSGDLAETKAIEHASRLLAEAGD